MVRGCARTGRARTRRARAGRRVAPRRPEAGGAPRQLRHARRASARPRATSGRPVRARMVEPPARSPIPSPYPPAPAPTHLSVECCGEVECREEIVSAPVEGGAVDLGDSDLFDRAGLVEMPGIRSRRDAPGACRVAAPASTGGAGPEHLQ